MNADLLLDNTTTFYVKAGATFAGGASLINSSSLFLQDAVDVDVLLVNDGVLNLGFSGPGQTIGQDFEQSASGTWLLELGGTGLSSYDRMTLTGLASLAGTLNINEIGGFTPSLGDSFTILLAGSVLGTFDSVIGTPGPGLAYDVIYNPGNVTLTVVPAAIPGDLDGDGFVGIADLNIVLSNWNQAVPPGNPLADPSGDGFVGIEDLNEVLSNWNAGTPPQSSSNIPEPGVVATLGVLGAFMLRRRWL
ncbi:MAG: hypothetical protein Kow00105_19580 [Phycisphaeraceae bacterium]